MLNILKKKQINSTPTSVTLGASDGTFNSPDPSLSLDVGPAVYKTVYMIYTFDLLPYRLNCTSERGNQTLKTSSM